jgi:hypothetical protein|tara:strand:- start:499 stop:897 length:399 start_codon:yes stop_codon:yes gene_type:complete
MAQLRKFEQEAIVNQIMKTIKSKHEKENETIKTKKEYKDIAGVNVDIIILEDKISTLQQEKRELESLRRDKIKAFELDFNIELKYDYHNKLSFNFKEWTIRRDVEDQLAIALLDSEWKDNLPAIIEEIASQF